MYRTPLRLWTYCFCKYVGREGSLQFFHLSRTHYFGRKRTVIAHAQSVCKTLAEGCTGLQSTVLSFGWHKSLSADAIMQGMILLLALSMYSILYVVRKVATRSMYYCYILGSTFSVAQIQKIGTWWCTLCGRRQCRSQALSQRAATWWIPKCRRRRNKQKNRNGKAVTRQDECQRIRYC